jgi:hypothetical protein
MSCKIEFTSHVGENDVMVEATYTPGHSGEEPEVEINRVYIEHGARTPPGYEIDLDIEGLFTRTAPSRERVVYLYQSVEERLTEAAFAHVAES